MLETKVKNDTEFTKKLTECYKKLNDKFSGKYMPLPCWYHCWAESGPPPRQYLVSSDMYLKMIDVHERKF